ncbi:MAG: glycosyltransferase family 9 protein [Nanoarchaeota archaeon]
MASVKLIKFLDRYICSLICLLLSISKVFHVNKRADYKKILLIQLWGMGETILCLPAIKALKESSRNSSIDILVTDRVKDIFYNNRSVGGIISVKLSPVSIIKFIIQNCRKYDIAIDMEEYLNVSSIMAFFAGRKRIGYSHGIRSNLYNEKVHYNDRQHTAQTFMDLLQPLGIKKAVKSLEKLYYSTDDEGNIDKLLKENNISKKDFIVGLGIGAAESVKERMWPEERFAEVADYLINKYKAKIIMLGNKEESILGENIIKLIKNKNSAFNFAGKTSAREMFYLASLCKLFIGNDAGPMHVAAAQNVKTIGLFGCNLPVRFRPFGKNGFYIYKKDSQEACINVHKGEIGACKFGRENACVKKIQVEDVKDLIKKVI